MYITSNKVNIESSICIVSNYPLRVPVEMHVFHISSIEPSFHTI